MTQPDQSATTTQQAKSPVGRGEDHPGDSSAQSRSSQRTPIRLVVLLLAMGVTILTLVVWVGLIQYRSTTLADQYVAPAILGEAPEFAFTERNGKPFESGMLDDRVWVVDFIFTHCAGPCPIMSATMARLQSEIADLPDVRLISISVDPDRDTPEVLTEYADRFGADPDRWLFLTGDIALTRRIAVDGFKVGSIEDPILHSDRFILVDRAGKIRGYFDSMEVDAVAKLTAAIRALHRESPP